MAFSMMMYSAALSCRSSAFTSGTMYCAIHAPTAQQRGICGIDDDVDIKFRNVGVYGAKGY